MTERLDAALARAGLARSRTQAQQLIKDGRVRIGERVLTKPSAAVPEDAHLEVDEHPHDRWVSRAAHKLAAALECFSVPVDGRIALDLGASTGGFTQVLTERGARRVIAVDVGHDQIAAQVAADPRVSLLEGVNARHLSMELLQSRCDVTAAVDVVTADLSFISLTLVLPAIATVTAPGSDIVVLIKPQFEVGRSGIRQGVVVDDDVRIDAVSGVMRAAASVGLATRAIARSPITGEHGNIEVLAHLTVADAPSAIPLLPASEWEEHVRA